MKMNALPIDPINQMTFQNGTIL